MGGGGGKPAWKMLRDQGDANEGGQRRKVFWGAEPADVIFVGPGLERDGGTHYLKTGRKWVEGGGTAPTIKRPFECGKKRGEGIPKRGANWGEGSWNFYAVTLCKKKRVTHPDKKK